MSFQLAAGLTPSFKSAVPFKGPVLIAIYIFTSVLALAAIGDAKVVLAGGKLPLAVIDRIVNGTIATSEFMRWLPVVGLILSPTQ